MVTIEDVRQVTFLQRASIVNSEIESMIEVKNKTIPLLEALAKAKAEREFWLERAKEIDDG